MPTDYMLSVVMEDIEKIKAAVIDQLTHVIDPETGVNVVRMRLIQDLDLDSTGKVTYTFRPSSPLCPIAVPLALMIIQAINVVPGVTGQSMKVIDYIQAEQLNELINTILTESPQGDNHAQ